MTQMTHLPVVSPRVIKIIQLLFSPSLGRSPPPGWSNTQTTLGVYGIVTQGQGSARNAAGVSNRPVRARKPTAKLKALSNALGSNKKRTVIITDDEDEAQPQKKKKKPREVEGKPNSDEDSVNPNEGPRKLNTRVFSEASEDAADTYANTEVSSKVSSDLGDPGNAATEDADATDEKGHSSDEELEYSQMDEMAAKDTQVSNNSYPGLL